MGLGPEHYAQTSVGRPVAREGPVVRYLSDVRRFGSDEVAPDFWGRSDVRTLECVGRPGLVGCPLILAWVRDHRSSGLGRSSGGSSGVGRPVPTGRPVAGASSAALLLVLALGVLAFLSMGFLLVPGHA